MINNNLAVFYHAQYNTRYSLVLIVHNITVLNTGQFFLPSIEPSLKTITVWWLVDSCGPSWYKYLTVCRLVFRYILGQSVDVKGSQHMTQLSEASGCTEKLCNQIYSFFKFMLHNEFTEPPGRNSTEMDS